MADKNRSHRITLAERFSNTRRGGYEGPSQSKPPTSYQIRHRGPPPSRRRRAPRSSHLALLCKLHHAAFDRRFLAVRPDHRILIRPDLLREREWKSRFTISAPCVPRDSCVFPPRGGAAQTAYSVYLVGCVTYLWEEVVLWLEPQRS